MGFPPPQQAPVSGAGPCRARRPLPRPPARPRTRGFLRAWLRNMRNTHEGCILVTETGSVRGMVCNGITHHAICAPCCCWKLRAYASPLSSCMSMLPHMGIWPDRPSERGCLFLFHSPDGLLLYSRLACVCDKGCFLVLSRRMVEFSLSSKVASRKLCQMRGDL